MPSLRATVLLTFAVASFLVLSSPVLAASRICPSTDTLLFGQQGVGSIETQSVTVTNCGDQPFSFTDVSRYAGSSSAYSIDTACTTGLTLPPRAACTIDVSFEPKAPGQVSGALWLHNTTSTPDQLLTFYGRGVDSQAGTATLDFSPAIADFGGQAVGTETPALVVTLHNSGPADLVPSALVLNGTDPYDFRGETRSVPTDCGIGRPIAAGGSCTLDLYFKPQAAGTRQATLVVDAPELAALQFLTLTGEGTAAPAPSTVNVVEFHDSDDDQYFLTADAGEAALLDGGGLGPAWSRTGQSFRAWPVDATDARALPVCRFFGTPGVGPESHFYTAYANECAAVRSDPHWIEEGVTFRAMLPVAGACPNDYATVLRFWKPGLTVTGTRHRYVVDTAIAAAMRAAGWVPEGAVFCAPLG